MSFSPWWVARVAGLPDAAAVPSLELGPLWRLRERIAFVRANVTAADLALDLARAPELTQRWADFEGREAQVREALSAEGERCAAQVRSGALGKAAFRDAWECLGFERHEDTGGTPADDYLDGLLHLSRHTEFMAPAPHALLNLATRAARVADFLSVTRPGQGDVVFDVGSGSGKLAITVAASCSTTVQGVEIEPTYTEEARRSSSWLGLENVRFDTADVRDVELAQGSIFYLYYPFHGAVARLVAQRLGALAREKDITIYAAGPTNEFGQYFRAEVDGGALRLADTRGEFGEVLVLQSARG